VGRVEDADSENRTILQPGAEVPEPARTLPLDTVGDPAGDPVDNSWLDEPAGDPAVDSGQDAGRNYEVTLWPR
jgi:hypothetical protein